MEHKHLVYGGLFLITLILVGGVIVYFGTPEGYTGHFFSVAQTRTSLPYVETSAGITSSDISTTQIPPLLTQDSSPDPDSLIQVVSPITLFVTGENYYGDLRGNLPIGLDGADLNCQYHAELAGLEGIYKALLSTNQGNAKDRIANLNIPVSRTDGKPLVFAAKHLFDKTPLMNKIQTESGVLVGSSCVWTGTDEFGRGKLPRCGN